MTMNIAAAPERSPATPAPLRVEPSPTAFVRDACAFADAYRDALAFRFLRLFTRTSADEFEQVIKKVYADAMPPCNARNEGLLKGFIRSLLQPFYYVISKTYVWKKAALVDYDVDAHYPDYFLRHMSRAFRQLPGTKRVSPLATGSFSHLPEFSAADSIHHTVTWRSLLLLFVAPLWAPYLLALSLRTGLDILGSYRRTLGIYASFDGHFQRYPCRHFITPLDETNHPARYLAFKHNCPGKFFLIQNGERTTHPSYAFGIMDYYLTFGAYMEQICRDLQVRFERVMPVGAIPLAERVPLIQEILKEEAPTPVFDVLMVDQSIYPYNGLDKRTALSFEKIFANLNGLKRNRPSYRVAYQLRPLDHDPVQKADLLATLSRFFTDGVEVLENRGQGESYRNICRTRLVITFNSTLGYESFFMGAGKKVLFVNYAGNPYEVYSSDPRFQIYDPSGDYESFERHVDYLLALRLDGLPEIARDRIAFPDDKVQERVAAFVLEATRPA